MRYTIFPIIYTIYTFDIFVYKKSDPQSGIALKALKGIGYIYCSWKFCTPFSFIALNSEGVKPVTFLNCFDRWATLL